MGRYYSLFILVCVLAFFYTAPVFAGACEDKKPFGTKININLTIAPPVYDLKKTQSYLTQNGQTTINKWLKTNNLQGLWASSDMEIAGLASGGWGVSYDMRMKTQNLDRYGAYHCPYFQVINIQLFYRTMIFIPRDYPEGTCAFDVIDEHEIRHHQVNTDAVEKYVARMEHDLNYMVRQMESYGPSPRQHIQNRFAQMQEGMRDAVQLYFQEAMYKEMRIGNSHVDTPEEYARSSVLLRACQQKDRDGPYHTASGG